MLTKDYFEKFDFDEDSKVAIISHNDLDGAGPIIIGDYYFKDYKYFTVANTSVDKVVKLVLFAPEYKDREFIFITDVSVSESVAQTIEKINAEGDRKIFLFDHHGTATFLNKYCWAHVTQEEGVSGTKLFFQFMVPALECCLLEDEMDFLERLSNTISDWDTWQWVKTENKVPKFLATLYDKTGINYFLCKYRKLRDNYDYKEYEILNDFDSALLADIEHKFKYLIWPAVTRSARISNLTFEIPGCNPVTKQVKFVQISDNPGDMAEQLYEDGVDYVIMLYTDTVSARSRVDDIDLGAWARAMSNGQGGGHKRSAGFKLTSENCWILTQYLQMKFEKENH
jgi:oligoribonuclease NrnB/cAMP/cGMP phosphodiesterase (DHH superfamily)